MINYRVGGSGGRGAGRLRPVIIAGTSAILATIDPDAAVHGAHEHHLAAGDLEFDNSDNESLTSPRVISPTD